MMPNNIPKVDKQLLEKVKIKKKHFFDGLKMTSDDTQTYPQHGQTILKKHDFHFFWTICQHNISCLIITCVILWYDMISYDMIWYHMISYQPRPRPRPRPRPPTWRKEQVFFSWILPWKNDHRKMKNELKRSARKFCIFSI